MAGAGNGTTSSLVLIVMVQGLGTDFSGGARCSYFGSWEVGCMLEEGKVGMVFARFARLADVR